MLSTFTKALVALPAIFTGLMFIGPQQNPLFFIPIAISWIVPAIFAYSELKYKKITIKDDSEEAELERKLRIERLKAQVEDVSFHRTAMSAKRDEQNMKDNNLKNIMF